MFMLLDVINLSDALGWFYIGVVLALVVYQVSQRWFEVLRG